VPPAYKNGLCLFISIHHTRMCILCTAALFAHDDISLQSNKVFVAVRLKGWRWSLLKDTFLHWLMESPPLNLSLFVHGTALHFCDCGNGLLWKSVLKGQVYFSGFRNKLSGKAVEHLRVLFYSDQKGLGQDSRYWLAVLETELSLDSLSDFVAYHLK